MNWGSSGGGAGRSGARLGVRSMGMNYLFLISAIVWVDYCSGLPRRKGEWRPRFSPSSPRQAGDLRGAAEDGAASPSQMAVPCSCQGTSAQKIPFLTQTPMRMLLSNPHKSTVWPVVGLPLTFTKGKAGPGLNGSFSCSSW